MDPSSQQSWKNCLEVIIGEIDSVISRSGEHSLRVANWCKLVAERVGIQGEALQIIYLGALFHDIGKIGVPKSILCKEGPLNKKEWEIMELHPVIGANIVQTSCPMATVIPIIHAHQERFDGRGYPSRLGGEHIPLGARILAVADAYDAMTDDRPYRGARSSEDAIEEIVINRGYQFDPQVVDVFLNLLQGDEVL